MKSKIFALCKILVFVNEGVISREREKNFSKLSQQWSGAEEKRMMGLLNMMGRRAPPNTSWSGVISSHASEVSTMRNNQTQMLEENSMRLLEFCAFIPHSSAFT